MKSIACTQTDIAKMNLASHHSFGSQLGGVYNEMWQYFVLYRQHTSRTDTEKCGLLFIRLDIR